MHTGEGDLYSALSECYKEPTVEFAADVVSGRLYELISKRLKQLDIPVLPEALCGLAGDNVTSAGDDEVLRVYKKLKEEYYGLFFPLYVVPVESIYKEWKMGKNEKGYIMGDPAIEMKKRYEVLGIEIPQVYKDTPDHIALLLEYASLLCENLSEEARERFVSDHLDWVEDLRDDICKYSQSDFYKSVADLTVAFVKQERSNLMSSRR